MASSWQCLFVDTVRLLDRLEAMVDTLDTRNTDIPAAEQEQLDSLRGQALHMVEKFAHRRTDTSYKMLLSKLAKKERVKRWRKHARRRKKERRSILKAYQDSQARTQSDWYDKLIAQEERKIQVAKEQREASRRRRVELKSRRAQEHMATLIEKLQTLRELRKQKLKKQGHVFPEDDNAFLESLRREMEQEQQMAEEEAGAARTDHTPKQEETVVVEAVSRQLSGRALAGKATGAADSTSHTSHADSKRSHQASTGSSFWTDYYEGAQEDIRKLVQIRWQWDYYIVPQEEATITDRIPPHFVPAPKPSSKEWEAYMCR
eukprot:GILK01005932.1.p1 GENE.GILK01005932.1~~GILK01005932.1.p1  ORF type:complete len:332 (-),score=62.72 GILK01005932.1:274-1227(-)